MSKPRILVASEDDADTFDWLSDGWYTLKQQGTPEAEKLMELAVAAIEPAEDVPDAIGRLESAGFEVVRTRG